MCHRGGCTYPLSRALAAFATEVTIIHYPSHSVPRWLPPCLAILAAIIPMPPLAFLTLSRHPASLSPIKSHRATWLHFYCLQFVALAVAALTLAPSSNGMRFAIRMCLLVWTTCLIFNFHRKFLSFIFFPGRKLNLAFRTLILLKCESRFAESWPRFGYLSVGRFPLVYRSICSIACN